MIFKSNILSGPDTSMSFLILINMRPWLVIRDLFLNHQIKSDRHPSSKGKSMTVGLKSTWSWSWEMDQWHFHSKGDFLTISGNFSNFWIFKGRPSLHCTELVARRCTDEGWEIWNALPGKYERPRLRNMKWVKCNLRSTCNKHPTLTNFHLTVTHSIRIFCKQENHRISFSDLRGPWFFPGKLKNSDFRSYLLECS